MADVVGCAVDAARIATGEIEDTGYEQPAKRAAGLKGANARKASLTPGERSAIARMDAVATWKDRT